MGSPLVTIITPLYNAEEFFEDTFKSVLSQSFSDYEWIIVDDCSADGSLALAKRLAEGHENIYVLTSDKNKGPSSVRNIGLRMARGRYVTFLDADDMWDPCFLEAQVAFIEEKGLFVCSSYRRVRGDKVSDYIVPEVMTYESILKGNPIAPVTALFDRSKFPDVFFDEKAEACEDLIFWLQILKSGNKCYGNLAVMATYRLHEGSRSHNKMSLISKQWYVYKREKLGFFKSAYCLFRWAIYGLYKYKDI